MNTKRGAPKKPPSERKVALTQIRLQASEKTGFEEAAELSGLSLSAWMRERLRDAATKELNSHGKIAAFIKRNKKADRKS